jgi:hypothetical protein
MAAQMVVARNHAVRSAVSLEAHVLSRQLQAFNLNRVQYSAKVLIWAVSAIGSVL